MILNFLNYLSMICLLFVSTYKLKQAPTYTEEHFDPAGNYVVELETNYHNILFKVVIRTQ